MPTDQDDMDLLDNEDANDSAASLPAPARKHLRQLEKDNAELRKQHDEAMARIKSIDRRDAFDKAVSSLAEADRPLVKVEDLSDIEPSAITPELLQVKALQASKVRNAALAEQAKAAGFDDVDTYVAVLERLKNEEAGRKEALANEVRAIKTGGSGPVVIDSDLTALKAYQDGLDKNLPPDYARAEFIKEKFRVTTGARTA